MLRLTLLTLVVLTLKLLSFGCFGADSDSQQAFLVQAKEILQKDPVSGLQFITKIEAEIRQNDPGLIPDLNGLKAEAQILLSQFDQAQEVIEETLATFDLTPNQRARFLWLKGDLQFVLGNEKQAYQWLNQAAKSVLLEGGPKLISEVIASRAVAAVNLNDLKQAKDDINILNTLADQLSDSIELANIYYAIAYTREGFEDYQQASEHYEKALNIFKRFQNEQQVSTIEYYLGRIYVKMKQPEKALIYFQSSLESAQRSGDQIGEAFAYWGIAKASEQQNELTTAVSYLRAADIILETSSNVEIKLGVLTTWAEVARLSGDLSIAKELLERAQFITERYPDELAKSKLELQLEKAKFLYATANYSEAYDTIFQYTEMNAEYHRSRREQAVQIARDRQQTDIKEKEYQVLYKQRQAELSEIEQQKQDNGILLFITIMLGFCTISFAMILKRNHKLKQTLEQLAITDELTQIANRRFVMQKLIEEFDRSQRYATPLSICIFDIDFFKKLNDNLGHVVGDEILKKVSRIAKDSIREQDVVGRIGGEEFLVVFPHAKIEESYRICERLRKSIAIATYPGAHKMQPTISIGVAELKESDSMDELLQRADKVLYQAKHNGRNQVVKE
jgi:diguanylate cyclase (GGDEF)-like protein